MTLTFDLWPITFAAYRGLVSPVTWWISIPNLNAIEQSGAELFRFQCLTLWPWTLRYVLRSAVGFTKFDLRQRSNLVKGLRISCLTILISLLLMCKDEHRGNHLWWQQQEAQLSQRLRGSVVITSFRIIQGHWFWSQSNARIRNFLSVNNNNLQLHHISHRFEVIADCW